MNTQEFIEKARAIHGDKYDYSKVEYVNAKTKVCIICTKHGEFWQRPSKHLMGNGCPKCAEINRAVSKRMSVDEFIRKAKEVHGDKYDYSKVEYKNNSTKICIICPEHGEFWQAPYCHLKGQGCPKCGVKSMWNKRGRIKTKEFIEKSKAVHGDKYDYSKVDYVDAKTKVCIICPEHGEFWQTPNTHLRGSGCPKCGQEKTTVKQRLTTEEFVRRAKEVHGNKYDYSKVDYVDAKTKVCIICPEHGEFWQTPGNHLYGQTCPKCLGKYKTTEEFIEESRKVHDNKYDYSKVEYNGSHIKVCIICPEHGEFWQTPHQHLRGQGCTICNRGLSKQYKFNLLQEFESEYEFRAFLGNNDINILYVILRNIEPKFEPIKADIENVLKGGKVEDPIKALEDKYTKEEEEDEEEPATNGGEEEVTTTNITNVDLDDDDAINQILDSNNKNKDVETNQEPTIEDIIKNEEKELEVVMKIEHLLTPEDREYVIQKFLNDKTRMWMAEREALKNV